jgi:three-Cys-motif partner protein
VRFCESDRRRFASLEERLEGYKRSLGGEWPNNVKVERTSDPFDATATPEMLDYLEGKGSRLAPTFAFVDPFGISGLPVNLLARLVRSPKCKLSINMIMNTAKRFATSGIIDSSLEELFGTGRFREAEGLTGRDRIMFLHDLYAEQLFRVAGMTYVQSFEMINRQGHTSYFLFYATRAIQGLRAMKEAMWRADPGGGYRFSDLLAGQDVLFSEDFLDVGPTTPRPPGRHRLRIKGLGLLGEHREGGLGC